jgi:surface protein
MINLDNVFLNGVYISFSGDPPPPPPPTSAFTLKVDTNYGRTVQIPFGWTTEVTIDWGDGTIEPAYGPANHYYSTDEVFTISVTGTTDRIGAQYGGISWLASFIEVVDWGNLGMTSLSYAFRQWVNLTKVPNYLPSTVTDTSGMFLYTASFNDPNVLSWDTSNVTNMNNMFYQATIFNQPIGNWNVSNVTDMSYMFSYATAFNQDISGWDTSSVINMNYMFNVASAFNQDLSNWCVSLIPTAPSAFDMGANLWTLPKPVWGTCPQPMVLTLDTSIDTGIYILAASDANLTIDWGDGVVEQYTNPEDYISHTYSTPAIYTAKLYGKTNSLEMSWNYNITGVTDWGTLDIILADWMFDGCKNLEYLPNYIPSTMTSLLYMLSGTEKFNHPNVLDWDVSNVTEFAGLFFRTWVFNQPIGTWNVSNATSMSNMFAQAKAFNQPIGSWDVSKVTDMRYMFNSSLAFNQDLSGWNTSSVTNMAQMFGASVFNHPSIGSWNTGNVTDMQAMFAGSLFTGPSLFNQPIGNWDVSKVTNMSSMFNISVFDQPLNTWNTGNVTDMRSMFVNSEFNQPIGNWNVSKVSTMSNMFSGAQQFNQDISAWNTISVSNMNYMFRNATAFNQDLSTWCVSLIPVLPVDFDTGATSWTLSRPVWGTCPP